MGTDKLGLLEKQRLVFADVFDRRRPKYKPSEGVHRAKKVKVVPDIQGYMAFVNGRVPLHPRDIHNIVANSRTRWTIRVEGSPWLSLTDTMEALALAKGFTHVGKQAEVVPA